MDIVPIVPDRRLAEHNDQGRKPRRWGIRCSWLRGDCATLVYLDGTLA